MLKRPIFYFLFLFLNTWTVFAATNSSVTYSGRILRPDGTPLDAAAVNFQFVIKSATNCVLWTEVQTINMAGSGGAMSFELGSAAAVNLTSGTHSFANIFDNSLTLGSLTGCDSGSTYTPGSTDDRSISVSFNDGNGSNAIPPIAVKSVPFASFSRVADSARSVQNLIGIPLDSVAPTNGQFLKFDGPSGKWIAASSGAGVGSVTQIGLIGSSLFNVTGGPISTAGTFNLGLATVASGNQVLASPDSAGGAPTFRAMVANDVPVLPASKITSGTLSAGVGGTGLVPAAGNANQVIGLNAAGTNTEYKQILAGAGVIVGTGTAGQIVISASAGGSGTVTQVNTGAGLSGGPITTAGTISLATSGIAAGTFGSISNYVPWFNFDTYGRATSAGSLQISLNANQITTGTLNTAQIGALPLAALPAQSANISNTLVLRDSSGNFAAGAVTLQGLTLQGPGTISISTPATANYSMILPNSIGTPGQVLRSDGTSGLSWMTPSSGISYPLLATTLGSVATPAYSFNSDSDTGIYSPGVGTLAITTNGTNRINVDSRGYVGIGTSSATALLDVNGDARINGLNIGIGAGGISSNTVVGFSALANNSVGFYNTAVGYNALFQNTGSSNNTAQGAYALYQNTGGTNTAQGAFALNSNGSGGQNTAQGASALYNNTVGWVNTAQGMSALAANISGWGNTAQGVSSLLGNTTGSFNVGVGFFAGRDIKTGSSNIVIGYYPTSGVGISNGSNSIMIGSDVRPPQGTLASNQLNIGNLIFSNGLSSGVGISTGSLGIGVTTPASFLDIAGGIRLADDVDTCIAGKAGTIRYNSSTLQFCNGSSWGTLGVAGVSGVAQVNTGAGLTGGPIAGVGTISLATTSVTAGSFGSANFIPTFIVDAYGRLTGAGSVAVAATADLSTIAGTLGVAKGGTGLNSATAANGQLLIGNGTGFTLGTLNSSVGIVVTNSAGTINVGTNAQTTNAVNTLVMRDGVGGFAAGTATLQGLTLQGFGTVGIATPLTANYSMTLPANIGTPGQVLTTNGTNNLSWANASVGVTFPLLSTTFGSVATPAYSFAADSGTGIYSPGAGTFAIATSGTARITIGSLGYVGIGTSTPTQALEIAGAGAPKIQMPGSTSSPIQWGTSNNPSQIAGTGGYTGFLSFRPDGNNIVTLRANEPGFTLTVEDSGFTSDDFILAAGPTGSAMSNTNGGTLALKSGISRGTGNSTIQLFTAPSGSSGTTPNTPLVRMTINGSGQVGIGTAAIGLGSRLEVYGGAIAAGPRGAAAGDGGELRMKGLLANGTNSVAFRAPDSIAQNVTMTLPGTIGVSGQVLSTDGVGQLSWVTGAAGVTFPLLSTTFGSVGTPAYSFASNTTTGIYSPGVGSIALTTMGTDRINISSQGNIGIGTTATAARLTITPPMGSSQVPLLIQAEPSTNEMTRWMDSSGNYVAYLAYNSGLPQFRLGKTNTLSLTADWGGSGELLGGTVISSKNLGIMTTGFGGTMWVGYYNNTKFLSAVEINDVASGFGTLRLMKSGGNVGIGTTSVGLGNQLEVYGGAIAAGPRGAAAGDGGELRMKGLLANGTNSVAFRAPDSISQNITMTLPGTIGTSGQVLSTDGAGTLSWITAGSGLSNFTESISTSAPNATVFVSTLTASNGGAVDIDAALVPKGAGALIANVSDNTTAGGNKRGQYAVDWQRVRNNSNQVASGPISTVSGGRFNRATGSIAVAAGGAWNDALGDFSVVSGGQLNTAGSTGAVVVGGSSNNATQQYAVVGGGIGNTASNIYATVVSGSYGTASGQGSTVLGGGYNWAYGNFSIAGNTQTTSQAYAQTTFGQFNVLTGGNNLVWTAADVLLAVGNGTSAVDRSNALTVFKNGNVAVGTTSVGTGVRLDVSGGAIRASAKGTAAGAAGEIQLGELVANGTNSVAFRAPDNIAQNVTMTLPGTIGTSGQVLSTNGAGVLSWISASSALSYPLMSTTFGSVSTPAFSFAGDSDTGIYSPGAGTFGIAVNGLSALTISNNGIGIDNSNPNGALEINRDGGTTSGFNGGTSPTLNINRGTGNFAGLLFGYWADGSNDTDGLIGTSSGPTGLVFATRPSGTLEIQMKISQNGNVGIGTTAPKSSLDVNGGVIFNSSYEALTSPATIGATVTISDTSRNIQRYTLSANTMINLPAFVSPTSAMYTLTIFLTQDATGSRTVNFAGNGGDTIKWDTGVAPNISTTASKTSIVQLIKASDSTFWYGSLIWREN